jgi:hypothetical protein
MFSAISEQLSKIKVAPVTSGAVSGPEFEAGALWEDSPVLLYVVRRPGCILCREEGAGLSSRFASGEYKGAKLIGKNY